MNEKGNQPPQPEMELTEAPSTWVYLRPEVWEVARTDEALRTRLEHADRMVARYGGAEPGSAGWKASLAMQLAVEAEVRQRFPDLIPPEPDTNPAGQP
ncbi:MAG TPA: hypothetical protein VG604_01130 [Candidatus Saccharimonadales bacterium]|nr:hypothetical protein [Candidatus Saccharimonadales bacterium]